MDEEDDLHSDQVFGHGAGATVAVNQLSHRDQIVFFVSFVCNGALQNPAKYGYFKANENDDLLPYQVFGHGASATVAVQQHSELNHIANLNFLHLCRSSPESGDCWYKSRQIKDDLQVFGHGAGATVAVKQLSFGVPRGECLCLLGPNGAGHLVPLI